MYLKSKFYFVAVLMLLSVGNVAPATSANPTTGPASTQPIMTGRDTPAGAMNAYQDALKSRDLATAADTFGWPRTSALMNAAEWIADSQLFIAISSRFGQEEAVKTFDIMGMRIPALLHPYRPTDWSVSSLEPDFVAGKSLPGEEMRAPDMVRGADGIWRMGIKGDSPRPQPSAVVAAARTRALARAAHYDEIIAGIASGKYATTDDIINAVNPQAGSAQQQRARYQERQQEMQQAEQMRQEQEKEAQAEMKQFMATKFDPSTVQGAVFAFVQARAKRDTASMTNFFFADNDPPEKLARANAERIADVIKLEEALRNSVDQENYSVIAPMFGLSSGGDHPEGYEPQVNGDRAALTSGGDAAHPVWLRQVAGIWKEDLTPKAPMTSSQAAQEMEHDNAAVEQITADILAGKIKTLPLVRDALGEARLYAPSPAVRFWLAMPGQGNFEVPGDVAHSAPLDTGVQGPAPTNRSSPAGAMNSFAAALENLDAKGVVDSIDIPGDTDGAYCRALVNQYLAGRRFLVAVEARFGTSAADSFAGDYNVPGDKKWMLDYTDDEWIVTPDYPDLAFPNRAALRGEARWVPVMHRGTDRVWRIARRFPENPRLIHERTLAAASNVTAYENAIAAIKAGKYATPADMANEVVPSINQISLIR